MNSVRIYLKGTSPNGGSIYISAELVGRKSHAMVEGMPGATAILPPQSTSGQGTTDALRVGWKVMRWVLSCKRKGLTFDLRSLDWAWWAKQPK